MCTGSVEVTLKNPKADLEREDINDLEREDINKR